ncbi:MAG: TetR/AcrR family transcriptional regulator [Bacteroidetes bacterium]|nr:TetR/AcrR family transcriptional regulator [Bacteroidota bacterium]
MNVHPAHLKIIDTARSMMYQHGIKRITMDDIARHAGISKKTIYETFDDKNELVLALLHDEMSKNQQQINSFVTSSKNAIEEIVATMNYMSNEFGVINPVMFYDLIKYHHQAWNEFNNFMEECVNSMIELNLKRGMKEGYYRSDLKIKILSRLRLLQIEMIINGRSFPVHKYNFIDVHIELMKHFLFGIATLKGHKLINKLLDVNETE